MYDLNLLKQVRESLSVKTMPFLGIQRVKAQQDKPYQGLHILHNAPLTLITAFKIEVLALGGAEITVTSPSFFPIEKRTSDLLTQAGFRVQRERKFKHSFDFHLDCCAELLSLPEPQIGAVELTQSGSKIYENAACHYPVISVDDSELKVLETFFGTGDGLYRALQQHVGDDMHGKAFVIFGHGKVGRGIVYALQQISNDITVVESDDRLNGCYPNVRYIDTQNISAIKEAISKAYCAITATGVKQVITDYYDLHQTDFGNALLVNMGADDEYGSHFSEDRVLFKKRALNFSLEEPTAFHYLDPILYAHNMGIDLILSKQIRSGYHPFPHDLAKSILGKWQTIYQENMEEALRT